MLFLHQLTFSTKIIICRKTNIFIFNALANKDTCRTSNRGVYMYYVEKNFFWDMFLGVPFQVGLFRGSALTVLPCCRFVPHSQCSRAGRTRCFSLSVLSRCRFVPHLQCYRSVRTASFHPRFLPRCRFVPRLQCSRTVRSAAFHPRFLPRCRFVPRLQCYRTASDSLAPLLSLTQRNACQPYCRDTCPRHGAVRQSGIPAAYPTAALRSAVG